MIELNAYNCVITYGVFFDEVKHDSDSIMEFTSITN